MAELPAGASIPAPELAGVFAALAAIGGADPAALLALLTERIVGLSLAAACTAHLVDDADELELAAHCPGQARLARLGDLQGTDGPAVEAVQTGAVRTAEDLEHHRTRWPSFAPDAHRAGFRGAEAVPLRGPDGVLGVVTTLHLEPLTPDDHGRVQIVQGLAVVAASRMADQRVLTAARAEVQHLTQALHSRVLIEQAKGMLAGASEWDPEQAFDRLRRYARQHNLVLSEAAEAVIERRLSVEHLDPTA